MLAKNSTLAILRLEKKEKLRKEKEKEKLRKEKEEKESTRKERKRVSSIDLIRDGKIQFFWGEFLSDMNLLNLMN